MPDDPEVTDPPAADLQAQVAQLQAQIRQERLGRILDGLGAPASFASVYQGELTEEGVKAFVASLQMAPPAPAQRREQAPEAAAWGAYEDAGRGGAPAQPPSHYEKLLEETKDALMAVRNTRYAPDSALDDKFSATIEKVNKLNRLWEREIRAGRSQAAYIGNSGFGGRLDPPPYTYRALDKAD